MRYFLSHWTLGWLLLCVFSCSTAASNEASLVAGKLRFYVKANSSFDTWTKAPSAKQALWMRSNYYRMVTYSPYFDKRLPWFPNAWVYKDAYALKPSWPVYRQHADWGLVDGSGQKLYIPYACKAGRCPQYAADFGNPQFVHWWINEAKALVDKGYIGVRIDDVNMDWRISNGNGKFQVPIDPRTKAPMLLADYRRYMAEFVMAVRQAIPNIEIVHNTIWYAAPLDDPSLKQQILASDFQGLQRGVSDRGITSGQSKYSFTNFLAYVDFVHSLGRHIILDDDDRKNQSAAMRDYELAFYFLITDGGDLIGADGDRSRMHPEQLYAGYTLNLGKAAGPRVTTADGLLRRKFSLGLALLNPPGQPETCTSELQGMFSILGEPVQRVCLASARGVVLLNAAGVKQNPE